MLNVKRRFLLQYGELKAAILFHNVLIIYQIPVLDHRISGCSLLSSRALFLMTKSNFQPPKLKDKLKW